MITCKHCGEEIDEETEAEARADEREKLTKEKEQKEGWRIKAGERTIEIVEKVLKRKLNDEERKEVMEKGSVSGTNLMKEYVEALKKRPPLMTQEQFNKFVEALDEQRHPMMLEARVRYETAKQIFAELDEMPVIKFWCINKKGKIMPLLLKQINAYVKLKKKYKVD